MDYEKPFACTYAGCDMTFATQENLTMHKKKHLMLLNFDNGARANTCVDQTPTPTRFIRNCEEVGLFQDLQNVNPFEETFRKANEAGSAGHFIEIDSDVLSSTDDTLHTPPFYPNITGQICAPSSTQTTVDDRSDTSIREATDVESNDDLNKRKSQYFAEATPVSQTGKQTRPKLNISSKRKNTVRVFSNQDVTNIARGRLQLETNVPSYNYPSTRPIAPHPSAQSSGTLSLQTTAPDYNQQQNALVQTKLVLRKTLLNQKRVKPPSNDSSSLKKVSKTLRIPPQAIQIDKQTADELLKQKQFRERNRVAASRCREKRKKWIEELENQVRDLQNSNINREVEVSHLRMELEKYKALLLKHRDCSVTRAENQGASEVLPETPSKDWTNNSVAAPLSSSEVAYQRFTNTVGQAIVLEKKQSAVSDSSKISRNAAIRVVVPCISGKVSKTLSSMVECHPLNAGIISGELNRVASPPRDPILSSAVACDGLQSRPPPAIPIITNVASISPAIEGASFLKTSQLTSDSGKFYVLNMPITELSNVPSAELKTSSVQENRNEPCGEDVLVNSMQVPKSGIFIIVKNISDIIKEAEPEAATIQVPEMSIMDTGEIPLSLEKPVNPECSVEEMLVCPDSACNEDDDVIFLKEIPPTRV